MKMLKLTFQETSEKKTKSKSYNKMGQMFFNTQLKTRHFFN